jgi:hypothetical protein
MNKCLEAFRHLPKNDKITLFLPKEVHFAQLPTQNYEDFQAKHEDYVVEDSKVPGLH